MSTPRRKPAGAARKAAKKVVAVATNGHRRGVAAVAAASGPQIVALPAMIGDVEVGGTITISPRDWKFDKRRADLYRDYRAENKLSETDRIPEDVAERIERQARVGTELLACEGVPYDENGDVPSTPEGLEMLLEMVPHVSAILNTFEHRRLRSLNASVVDALGKAFPVSGGRSGSGAG